MKPNPVVVLHGWSDNSSSFKPLAAWLRTQGFPVTPIFLGDYLSMNDEITLKDLGYAFIRALNDKKVPQTPHAFDVIVHSTGGLVIREYLRQVCEGTPETTPVQNLLMFSPANFGSPLAALGKSVLGRLINGWDWNHFGQTGEAILNGLELASPYSWDLAMSDLLSPTNVIYDPKNTLVTVFGGTAAYSGFRSALHENGSDGTVRVSTATLNTALLRLDCSNPDPINSLLVEKVTPPIAFAVFDRDHGAIHDPADPRQTAQWTQLVLNALTIGPDGYADHVALCDKVAQDTFANGIANSPHPERYNQYQTLVVRVHDQFGDPVPDYMLEFYQDAGDDADNVFSAIHGDILEKVTTDSVDASYRSFLFNITSLRAYLAQNPNAAIEMSVSAASVSERITYRNPESGVPIFTGAAQNLIRPNTPLLVDIVLYRDPSLAVFYVTPAP
jgi:pimeloyl-ACP methyl ester carboxylesterase